MNADGFDSVTDTLHSRVDGEYDERTFQYFLRIERSSAERADRALWLLLVSAGPVPGEAVPMEAATASRIFTELRASLRETDVIGWYQQDRVVGALLSAFTDSYGSGVAHIIQDRVTDALRRRVPAVAARELRVRVALLRRPTGDT